MALPVTIANVQFPTQNNYFGPFLSGGAFYTVLLDSGDASIIEVHKATDPTDSFAEQDSGDKPDLTNTCRSLWVYQLGTDLHIAHQETTTGRVGYSLFHMATDQWDGTFVNLLVEAPTNGPTSNALGCSIAVRSDGDVIVLYAGDTDREMGNPYQRVDYGRKENGTFANVGIAVGGTGATEDWAGSVIVRGSSDRMHFFFANRSLNDGFQRTLQSDNTLESLPAAGDSSLDTNLNHPFGPGVSYDDSGTQRVRCPYSDSSDKVSYAEFDSANAPGAFTPNVDVSDNTAFAGYYCMAVDGTDEYLLYADRTDGDLYQDKNDGTDTEVLDGVAVDRISCNGYARSGQKLAYIYRDGGTIKYNEVDIGGAPADEPELFELPHHYLAGFNPLHGGFST